MVHYVAAPVLQRARAVRLRWSACAVMAVFIGAFGCAWLRNLKSLSSPGKDSILMTRALAGVQETQAPPPKPVDLTRLYTDELAFHPPCGFKHKPTDTKDLTLLLKNHSELINTCISNPSIATLHPAALQRRTLPRPSSDPSETMVLSPGLVVMSYRIYFGLYGDPCVAPDEPGGQWHEGWKGRGGLGLAILRWPEAGGEPEVLHQWHEIPSTREDARLFRDDKGKIRLTYNRWHGGDPAMLGIKRFQRRSMHVVEVVVETDFSVGAATPYRIHVQNEQEILYLNQQRDEKNWVPWEGSTKMTYPQYPGFQPHVVLDWKSYDKPEDRMQYESVAPVDLMHKVRALYGNWIRFSGGTPSVRLDEDRYLAVGHVVGDVSCFHAPADWDGSQEPSLLVAPAKHRTPPQPRPPALRALERPAPASASGSVSSARPEARHRRASARAALRGVHALHPSGPAVRGGASEAVAGARSGAKRSHTIVFDPARQGAQAQRKPLPTHFIPHWCNASYPAPDDELDWDLHFKEIQHQIPKHHPRWEYLFFLYTFSAHPPHNVTHISHAFIFPETAEHQGVVFPTGLERLPTAIKRPTASEGSAPPAVGDPGSAFLLTYGHADYRVRTTVLGPELLDEWLLPVDSIKPNDYRFCTTA